MRFPGTTVVGLVGCLLLTASGIDAKSAATTADAPAHPNNPKNRGLRTNAAFSSHDTNHKLLDDGRNLQASSIVCEPLIAQLSTSYSCTCEDVTPTSVQLSCETPSGIRKCEPLPGGGEICAEGQFTVTLSGMDIPALTTDPDVTFESCYDYISGSSPPEVGGQTLCLNYKTGIDAEGEFATDYELQCDVTLGELPCGCTPCNSTGAVGIQIGCDILGSETGVSGSCRGLAQENIGRVPILDTIDEGDMSEDVEDGDMTIPETEGDDNATMPEPENPIEEEEPEGELEPGTPELEEKCVASGGTVTVRMCCESADEFPSTCLVGACGCALEASKEVTICECPEGTCYDSRDSLQLCVSSSAGTPGEEDGSGAEEPTLPDDQKEDDVGDDEATTPLPETAVPPGEDDEGDMLDKGINMTESDTNTTMPEEDGMMEANLTMAELCTSTGGVIANASVCIGSDEFPGTCGLPTMNAEPTSSPTIMADDSSNMTDDSTNMTDMMEDMNMTDAGMNMTEPTPEPAPADDAATEMPTGDETNTTVMGSARARSLQIGAFGCSPMDSEEKAICECPEGFCFSPDGGCISEEDIAMPEGGSSTTAGPTVAATDSPTTDMPTAMPTIIPTASPTIMTSSPTAGVTEAPPSSGRMITVGSTMIVGAVGMAGILAAAF